MFSFLPCYGLALVEVLLRTLCRSALLNVCRFSFKSVPPVCYLHLIRVCVLSIHHPRLQMLSCFRLAPWRTLPRVQPSTRLFHQSTRAQEPLELAYECFEPPASHKAVAKHTKGLVICHGLYGSKQNWRSLAKSMTKSFGVPVYTLDLRNHGMSPHAESMSYLDMASDVRKFFDDKNLSDMTLIGHSMGGKVVMAMALDPNLPDHMLSHLISVDMSPAEGPISPEFMEYARCMAEINKMNVKSRSEADKVLQKIEPTLSVRQFLLTNLERDGDAMHFRIPVDILIRSLSEIGYFPYAPPKDDSSPPERQWEGRTLFVKGEKSKYINRRNLPLCKAYFPHMELTTMPTGHWCHAEKPNEFMRDVHNFLVK